jgi:hypothetical protein
MISYLLRQCYYKNTLLAIRRFVVQETTLQVGIHKHLRNAHASPVRGL